jgi:hypothetical protein
MAYSEQLANRVRALLSDRDDVAERPRFGGLTFMVGGHMCCGVLGDELIVRLHADDEDAALARPDARPVDFTARPMRGFVTVPPDGLKRQGAGTLGPTERSPTPRRSHRSSPSERRSGDERDAHRGRAPARRAA